MKRIYTTTSVAEESNGFAVLLDAATLRTPARRPVRLPTRPLAEAIAAEWAAQGEVIDRAALPLTSLACIALDLAADKAEEMREELAEYGSTDQLCYRDPALKGKDAALADPLLDWAHTTFAAKLRVTDGIVPVEQPAESLEALRRALLPLSIWELAAVSLSAGILRSLVASLALLHRRIDAEEAFRLAGLEETQQAEQWGMDPVQEARLAVWQRDLAAVAQWLELLRM